MPILTKQNVRDKILSSALKLFTARGYFNTSMRDITRESAVSTGSVYHYFKDKEGLAASLYQTMVDRMCSEFDQITISHESAHDQCHAVVKLLFTIAENEPESMSFMLYTKHQEFLPLERPVCSSKPFEMMRHMVKQGMQHGEIEERDDFVASTCLFGGPIRLIIAHLDGALEKPLADYLDDTWICSWKAVT